MDIKTTGIGSLPHINVDSAISYSFRFDIPFLPQLPVYNSNEYMLFQSLFPLPGLQKPVNGIPLLDLKLWLKNRGTLHLKAEQAHKSKNYSEFLPPKDVSSCLNAFIFELEQNKSTEAKFQLCGPFTCINSLKLTDHTPVKQFSDIVEDIELCVDLVARALLQKTQDLKITRHLYFDEPALIIFSKQNRFHRDCLDKLRKLLNGLLTSENLELGVHCCANTDWSEIFKLPINCISFDYQISAHHISELPKETWGNFQKQSKHLMAGLIPTSHTAEQRYKNMGASILELIPLSMGKLILSPACGLAHTRITDTEEILTCLQNEKKALQVISNSN